MVTVPKSIILVCVGALVGQWFAMMRLAFSGRGAGVPCLPGSGPGGGNDEDSPSRRFDSNPLDSEQHYPPNDLGMPGEPLTVETARLCDPAGQALLSPKWFWCPEDPTCEKCSRNWERNTDVTRAFQNPKHVQARKAFYQNTFKAVPHNTVTVQAVNYGQVHLWLNWVCSCEANGFQVRESTLMVPADPEAEKVILEAGFHSVGLDWIEALGDHKIRGDYSGMAGTTQQHSDINNILMMATAEVLAAGNHVLMVDVDIAWIRDPRIWLTNDALRADVLAMVAARWDAQGTANTGMVFMRSNRRTKLLMDSVVNLFPIKGWSDQVLFNQVLRHFKMRQVSFHNLPHSHFPVLPNPNYILKTDWRAEAYTAHAVGNMKEQRLEMAGLKFYNSSCSLFHKDLKPWVTVAPPHSKR